MKEIFVNIECLLPKTHIGEDAGSVLLVNVSFKSNLTFAEKNFEIIALNYEFSNKNHHFQFYYRCTKSEIDYTTV